MPTELKRATRAGSRKDTADCWGVEAASQHFGRLTYDGPPSPSLSVRWASEPVAVESRTATGSEAHRTTRFATWPKCYAASRFVRGRELLLRGVKVNRERRALLARLLEPAADLSR